jgi:peroxiredoxin Q/BCP
MALLRMHAGLKPGEAAPDFDCLDEDGQRHRLGDFKGRWLVLFFYPKDGTPICAKEACQFNEDWDSFRSLGADVLGCSVQDAGSHRQFRKACRLRYRLLTDVDGAVLRAYKVRHLLGRFRGRSTFLIGPDGLIRFVHDDRVDGLSHPALALKALRLAVGKAA